jgi:peptidoglycan-associated lipoprotein
MRMKYVVLLFAGLAVAACETTPENSGAASGSGNAGAQSGSGAVGSQQGGVSTEQLGSRGSATGPSRGSQEDLVVNVGDRVLFALDSYQLKPDARAVLEKQAAWLEQNPAVTVTIEGHADERGTREYNLALGDKRANAVRDYLIALGVNANRVRTISFGKERPVDPRSVEDAWAKNRRGVMIVN